MLSAAWGPHLDLQPRSLVVTYSPAPIRPQPELAQGPVGVGAGRGGRCRGGVKEV